MKRVALLARSLTVALVVVAGLAACSSDSPRTGMLTGNAQACSGAGDNPIARLSVFRGATVVASAEVPNDTVYNFTLQPGDYHITNTGSTDNGYDVHVDAGSVTHKDVPDICR